MQEKHKQVVQRKSPKKSERLDIRANSRWPNVFPAVAVRCDFESKELLRKINPSITGARAAIVVQLLLDATPSEWHFLFQYPEFFERFLDDLNNGRND